MKLMLWMVFFCSATAAAVVEAGQFNISDDYAAPLARESLPVTLRDVVLVETPSHGNAVIQFTEFRLETASYRWRYRACATCPVQTGVGTLKESYDRRQIGEGRYEVSARPDHDPIVKAGDIEIEWSFESKASGWLYYHPARAKVRATTNVVFEKYP